MYTNCVCFRRNIQNKNETINAFRITHKHLRSIKMSKCYCCGCCRCCCRCRYLLLWFGAVWMYCIVWHSIALCVVLYCVCFLRHCSTSSVRFDCSFFLPPLIVHPPSLTHSRSLVALHSLLAAILQCAFGLVCLFHLFISSTCVVVVVVIINLITLILYAEIHDFSFMLVWLALFPFRWILGQFEHLNFLYKKRRAKKTQNCTIVISKSPFQQVLNDDKRLKSIHT